jgi:hypothetical protein
MSKIDGLNWDVINAMFWPFLFFGLPLLIALGSSVYDGNLAKCNNTQVQYAEVPIEDANTLKGMDYVKLEGKGGTEQVCSVHGKDISRQTVALPVTQIKYIGVKEPVIYTPPVNTYNGGGAICADGTRSYSTGRGTCSWHGGVSYWL